MLSGLEIKIQTRDDILPLMGIVRATGFFRPDECDIAEEVMTEAVDNSNQSGYLSYVAFYEGLISGWICFGPIACAEGAFDIYWLVVSPNLQSIGIGSQLLRFAHTAICKSCGRLAVVETSGMDKYIPTQRFYEKNGYELCANLEDFYMPGDSKLIYINYLN